MEGGPLDPCPHDDRSPLPDKPQHPPGTRMDGGPLDPRFHDDEPNSDVDIVAMDVERKGGDPLPPTTRYDIIMRQCQSSYE